MKKKEEEIGVKADLYPEIRTFVAFVNKGSIQTHTCV